MHARVIPFPVESFELDNGLKTVVVPMPSNGLLCLWTIVRTGSRDENEPGRTGFAHFFEHMMFRGTRRFPADGYRQALLELGADANAFTTDDLTAYQLTLAASGLERGLEIESDRFQNLDYPEADFRTEAGAVYGEYRKFKTDPVFMLFEAVRAKAFERHSYGHTTMGYEADIAAMPGLYDFSREFFARNYRPENTILLVCGDAKPAAVEALVRRYYGHWPRGYVATDIPGEPEQLAARRVEATYPGRALPLVWLAWKVGRADPGDRLRSALDLLVDLSFGETSEVYRRLVLQEQALEYLEAAATPNRDPSLLDVSARIKDPEQIERVIAELDAAAARATEELVDTARLENLKTRKRYDLLMQLDSPDSVARALCRPLAIDGDVEGLEQRYATYATLTPAELRAAARSVLAPSRRTIGVLRADAQA